MIFLLIRGFPGFSPIFNMWNNKHQHQLCTATLGEVNLANVLYNKPIKSDRWGEILKHLVAVHIGNEIYKLSLEFCRCWWIFIHNLFILVNMIFLLYFLWTCLISLILVCWTGHSSYWCIREPKCCRSAGGKYLKFKKLVFNATYLLARTLQFCYKLPGSSFTIVNLRHLLLTGCDTY